MADLNRVTIPVLARASRHDLMPTLGPAAQNWLWHSRTDQVCFCLAALTVQWWDMVISLPEEVVIIWSSPRPRTQATYLMARYFGLSFQTVNFAFLYKWLDMKEVPTFHRRCTKYYGVLLIGCWIFVSTHQAVMVFEVIKRYQGRYPRVGWYLIAIYLVTAGIICGSIVPAMPHIKYDGLCNPIKFGKEVVIIVVGFIVPQMLLWAIFAYATVRQRPRSSSTFQWISKDILAQSAHLWGVLAVIWSILAVLCYTKQTMKTHLMVYWPMSFTSVLTSRCIMALRKEAMKLEAEGMGPGALGSEAVPRTDLEYLEADVNSIAVPSLVISPPDSMFDARDHVSQETGMTHSSIVASTDLNRFPSPLLELSSLSSSNQMPPSTLNFKTSIREAAAGSSVEGSGGIYVESARTASTASCYWRQYQDSVKSGGTTRSRPV